MGLGRPVGWLTLRDALRGGAGQRGTQLAGDSGELGEVLVVQVGAEGPVQGGEVHRAGVPGRLLPGPGEHRMDGTPVTLRPVALDPSAPDEPVDDACETAMGDAQQVGADST